MNRVKIGVGALVVALFATACGGSSATTDQATSDQVSLSLTESPINALLGIDIAMRSGDIVALERQAEEGVAECMLAAGFEYRPVDFAAQFEPETGADDPDSRGYAEVNGYGISIQPVINAPGPEDITDPNAELRSALTAPELEAYELALYGNAPLDAEPLPADERTGCVAESYDNVYAARAELGSVEQFFGEFGAELAELEERFRGDPRFVELEAQWATCMNEQGFAVSVREEVFVELSRRMSEVGPRLIPGEEPSAEVQAAMDEVSDWERSVAVADWDCTQPVQGEMQTLRYGYEALFLDENRDRISQPG